MTITLIYFVAFLLHLAGCVSFTTVDVFVPESCENTAVHLDHVLLTYQVEFTNSELGLEVLKSNPFELFHFVVDAEGTPIHKGIVGMCPNSTRTISFRASEPNELFPLIPITSNYSIVNEDLIVQIKVVHVTSPADYQIFPALNTNLSLVFDLIEEHKGIIIIIVIPNCYYCLTVILYRD